MSTATVADTKSRVTTPNLKKVQSDSLWIQANYGVTALSGMLFWVVAARVLPPSALGLQTAVLSIVMAAATMAAVGPGNALLAMLPASGTAAGRLMRTALQSVVLVAAVYGVAAGILVHLFLPDLQTPAWVIIPSITLATTAWALFVFKDTSFGALNHIRWAVALNGSANLLKLGLLVTFALLIGVEVQPVLSSAIVPVVFAVIIWLMTLLPRMIRNLDRRTVGDITVPTTASDADAWYAANRRPFLMFAFRDGTASSLNLGINMALTFLVSATAGPQAGAVFALCAQISGVLDLVVVGATGSLILNNAAGHANASHIAMRMWVRAFIAVAVMATIGSLLGPYVLGFLGAFYVTHGGVLVLTILLAGSVLRTAFEVWCGLLRANHRTGQLLLQNSITALLLLPATIIMSLLLGALGCALAVLGVTLIQAVLGFCGMLRARKQETPGV